MLPKLKNQAIDLLLEDVYTKHPDTRINAKKLNCEAELDTIREKLVDYLQSLR